MFFLVLAHGRSSLPLCYISTSKLRPYFLNPTVYHTTAIVLWSGLWNLLNLLQVVACSLVARHVVMT